ncbi:MAG: hypothetical protein EOO09_16165, partial [Chitinophagaceae bacterium]
MRKTGLSLLLAIVLFSCNNENNAPDVSGVKVSLVVKRFDRDFFAIDTTQLESSLGKLQQVYPDFLGIYMNNIAGITNPAEVRSFYASYRPVYDSAQLLYANFEPVRADLEKAFRYVKFYFPDYKLPAAVVPVVGPMNSRDDLPRMAGGDYSPDFIGPDIVGVSLQFYLGADFSFYKNQYFINNVAPVYRSRRFSR